MPVFDFHDLRFTHQFIYENYLYIMEKLIIKRGYATQVKFKILDMATKKLLISTQLEVTHKLHVNNFTAGLFLIHQGEIGYRFNYLENDHRNRDNDKPGQGMASLKLYERSVEIKVSSSTIFLFFTQFPKKNLN